MLGSREKVCTERMYKEFVKHECCADHWLLRNHGGRGSDSETRGTATHIPYDRQEHSLRCCEQSPGVHK